jgi:hypothetical protein
MGNEKHTPFPWEVEEDAPQYSAITIYGAGGSLVARCFNVDDLPCLDPEAYEQMDEEARANATLIAGIPQLLSHLAAVEQERDKLREVVEAYISGHSKALGHFAPCICELCVPSRALTEKGGQP